MAQYIILKTASNAAPPLGEIGSADMYLGDHVDLTAAMNAAAAKWRLGPGAFMWGALASTLTRYVTSVSSAAG